MRMVRITARCLTAQPAPQTLGELVWQLGIVTAALRVRGWDQDVRLGEQLCSAYLALSQMYQTNVWARRCFAPRKSGICRHDSVRLVLRTGDGMPGTGG